MEAGAFGVVDEVVFDEDVAGAFVGVDAPPAVASGFDAVDVVVAHARAGRDAEGVDPAHVGEQALPDVVDVVVFDDVAVALAFVVAPEPADGDAGVAQVVDFVVRHDVAGALADEHTHGLVPAPAATDDLVVGDDVAPAGEPAPGAFASAARIPAIGRGG